MTQNKTTWKKWHKWTLGILGGFILLMIIAVNSEPEESPATVKAMSKEDSTVVRKKKVEKLFSAWDGSLPALVKLTKSNLNDPGSFEHLETNAWDRDSLIVVKMQYTAKNAFGGRIRGYVMANADLEGNVIKIIESY